MIKRIALVLSLAVVGITTSAVAAPITFVGDGYVVLSINGASNVFYNLNNANDTTNPKFDSNDTSGNAFSETFTIVTGDSIKLGGELQTFPQQGGTDAFLGWGIFDLTETTGSFTDLSLPFLDQVGSNDRWQRLANPTGVEIGSSLAPGSYLLVVFQKATNGPDSAFNQEGAPGNNWEARINVIPEPSTLSLLAGPALLGGWFFLRRRRAS